MLYLPALSGLRAVACLAVVLFHSKVVLASGGYLGVDMFFVLSGYLTVSILTRNPGAIAWGDVGDFIVRRFRRVAPLLFVVCLSLGGALSLVTDMGAVLRELAWSMSFTSNIARAYETGPYFLRHIWTVASEMQFYVLIALVFGVVSRMRSQNMLTVFVLLFCVLTSFRVLAYFELVAPHTIYFNPILRGSGLVLGGAIALLPTTVAQRCAPLGWAALGLIVVGFMQAQYLTPKSFVIWGIAAELASAALILSLVARPDGGLSGVLSRPWLERLGLWSYGIYLWHYPIAVILRDAFDPMQTAILTLAVSVPLAALTYHLVEQRFRYGRKARATRDDALVAASS